jgi:hypothetical protein
MVDACCVYIKSFIFDIFIMFWMMFSNFGVPRVHHVLIRSLQFRVPHALPRHALHQLLGHSALSISLTTISLAAFRFLLERAYVRPPPRDDTLNFVTPKGERKCMTRVLGVDSIHGCFKVHARH